MTVGLYAGRCRVQDQRVREVAAGIALALGKGEA
jgi:hypothetical protein